MGRGIASVVAAGVLLAGEARADSGWREIRGPHVVLRTDLGSSDAREAALTVERFRAQIIAAVWPRAAFPARDTIEVTVFANGLDFERHFGRNIAGVFFHEIPPLAVMYGHPDQWEHRATLATPETTSVLRHELVHHLASIIYRRPPRWFSEGLAQFLETVRTSEDGKSVVVGAANLDAMQSYRSYRSLRVADALAWSGKLDSLPDATVDGLYGLSWVMVHWLYNEHSEQFAQFQALLAKGVDPDKAWKIILPGLNTPDLDAAINQYVRHGNYQEYLAPFAEAAPQLQEFPLGEADVHAERARVAMAAARSSMADVHKERGRRALGATRSSIDRAAHEKEAQAELATALRIDPNSASALVLSFGLAAPKDRPAIARQLTVAHPEDGRGWLLLGEALRDGGASPEREAVLKKAVSLRPQDPTALNNLAWVYLQQGKAGDAAPLVSKSIQLAPYDPYTLDTLAALQAMLGKCSEAAASESRALETLSESASATRRRTYEERLDRYRTRCTSGAAATPGGG